MRLRPRVQYEFYAGEYNGSLPYGDDWWKYENRARHQLERYKSMYSMASYSEDIPLEEAEDLAICAMIDAMAFFDAAVNGVGGPVASASIGSVSVNYAGTSNAVDLSLEGQAKELYRCASMYLDFYRGVG